MARFRSKPVEIEATQLTDDLIRDVLFGATAVFPHGLSFEGWTNPVDKTWGGAEFECATRQGVVAANIGDWIIQESDGSGCYPCKPDVFKAKYEPAG